MSSIAIVSLFRDRGGMVPRYIKQIESLQLDEKPHVVCVEGDSVDDTGELLDAWAETNNRVHVVHHDLGLPLYGSTVHPERFLILSTVANVGLDYVSANLTVDFVLFLEMDVSYEPNLVTKLLASHTSLNQGFAVVAPMVWIDIKQKGDTFYDCWAFRSLPGQETAPIVRQQQRFSLARRPLMNLPSQRIAKSTKFSSLNFPTESPIWFKENRPTKPYEVDSAGTVLLADASLVYRGARFTKEDVIIGYCKNAKKLGASTYVDPNAHVQHPPLGVKT